MHQVSCLPLAGGAQDLHQNSIAEVGYDSSPKDML